MELLLIVEDRFKIRNVGIEVTPGVVSHKVMVGDKIKLVRPDKSEFEGIVRGFTFETRTILIGDSLTKEDIPIGTQIWSIK